MLRNLKKVSIVLKTGKYSVKELSTAVSIALKKGKYSVKELEKSIQDLFV